MDKFEYRPSTFGADTVNMDGEGGFVGTAENVRSRQWARELGKSNLLSAARVAREVDVDFKCDFAVADKLREAADADVLARTPGTFVAQGEWNQRGYILESRPKGIHFGWLDTSLTIALLDGAWWRLRGLSLIPDTSGRGQKSYTQKSGNTVTAKNATDAPLHGLVIEGKSKQTGTPTPSSPKAITSVGADFKNLFGAAVKGGLSGNVSGMYLNTSLTATSFVAGIEQNTDYTITAFDQGNKFRADLFVSYPTTQQATSEVVNTDNPPANKTATFNSGSYNYVVLTVNTSAGGYDEDFKAQCEAGSSSTSYVPRGSLILNCGSTQTFITSSWFDANNLCSLPSGAKDTLEFNAQGYYTVRKNVAELTLHPSDLKSFTSAAELGGANYSRATIYNSFFSNIRQATLTSQNCICNVAVAVSSGTGEGLLMWRPGQDGYITLPDTLLTLSDARTWLQTNEVKILAQRNTQTIGIGSITMPQVSDNYSISVTAVGVSAPYITAEYEIAQTLNLDYPYDYEFDYSLPSSAGAFSTGRMVACTPRIIFYGSVTDPEITIAGNRYMVEGSVAAGARIEVDGRDKTVKLIAVDGTVTDKFADALRGSGEGGGEYIFEPIPPGTHSITWDGTFSVDVGWYDEVGEPPWSQS